MATAMRSLGAVFLTRMKGEDARLLVNSIFSNFAQLTSKGAGRPSAFTLALGIVVAWAISGPLFSFSDTWQLVINTGTTIVTFLMVFLIQNSQNRDSVAIQIKLDELIRISRVHNSFVGIEHLTDDEIEVIRNKCESRAKTELNSQRKRSARLTGLANPN